jgi:hypothetical protein
MNLCSIKYASQRPKIYAERSTDEAALKLAILSFHMFLAFLENTADRVR